MQRTLLVFKNIVFIVFKHTRQNLSPILLSSHCLRIDPKSIYHSVHEPRMLEIHTDWRCTKTSRLLLPIAQSSVKIELMQQRCFWSTRNNNKPQRVVNSPENEMDKCFARNVSSLKGAKKNEMDREHGWHRYPSRQSGVDIKKPTSEPDWR